MMTSSTSQLAAAYARDGFALVKDSVFSDDLLRRARAGMDMIRAGDYDTGEPPSESPWKPGDDPTLLCKIELPQKANLAIRELVSHPALGALTAEMVGCEMVQVWWAQLLYKPPGPDKKTVIGWHQDWSYTGSWEEGSEIFTAWIALSDVTADAGPMQFITGSHKWGFLKSGDFFGKDNAALRAGFELPEGAVWQAFPVLLPMGGVSVHDRLTLHGSEPNLSDGPRCSLAIHMRSEKATPKASASDLTRYLDNPDYNPVIFGAR